MAVELDEKKDMLENIPPKALFIRLSEEAVAPLAGAWIENYGVLPDTGINILLLYLSDP